MISYFYDWSVVFSLLVTERYFKYGSYQISDLILTDFSAVAKMLKERVLN